ncbi:MAG: hypothetical protein ACKOGM_06545 [Solirubrobacterales bacterium]
MTEQTMVHSDLDSRGATRCTGCGSPLASDQRYCLECGKRKGDSRVEFASYLPAVTADQAGGPGDGPPNGAAVAPPTDPAPDSRPQREITPLMAATGLAALVIILMLGVLIGRMGGDSSQPVVAATGVPTATAPTTGTDQTVSFTSDWPEGKTGFTVELATLPSSTDAAAVDVTKTDLTAQGATELGVLASDDFASLPPGNYVFYSGVFDKRADAEARLKELKGSFPDAQVIEVSDQTGGGGKKLTGGPPPDTGDAVKATELQGELETTDPGAYQEALKKLPTEIATEGETVAPDNKAPGGGSDAVTIG